MGRARHHSRLPRHGAPRSWRGPRPRSPPPPTAAARCAVVVATSPSVGLVTCHRMSGPAALPGLARLTFQSIPSCPGPMSEAFIIDAVRTPRGKRKGSLAGVHAVDLAAHVLTSALARTGVPAERVEEVAVSYTHLRAHE